MIVAGTRIPLLNWVWINRATPATKINIPQFSLPMQLWRLYSSQEIPVGDHFRVTAGNPDQAIASLISPDPFLYVDLMFQDFFQIKEGHVVAIIRLVALRSWQGECDTFAPGNRSPGDVVTPEDVVIPSVRFQFVAVFPRSSLSVLNPSICPGQPPTPSTPLDRWERCHLLGSVPIFSPSHRPSLSVVLINLPHDNVR